MNNQGSPIPSYGVSLNTTQVVDDINLITVIQEVLQIQITVTENGPEITTIINAPFVQVTSKVEAAFNFALENNHAFLAGAVSRKKQVVPQLTASFNA